MSAIVTDQFRIFNASNFVDSINNSSNSYYVFFGLSNPSPGSVGFGRTDNWDSNPPQPFDNIDYNNHNKTTILFGKKISGSQVRRAIRKIDWVGGTKYEMYRPDYSVINPSPITNSLRLYDANYYVINSNYEVYICIDNGSSGANITGNSSQIEPSSSDIEPIKLEDGYVWKYLYTISPSDIIKFDSTEYVTVPNNWESSQEQQISAVRENGNSPLSSNQIKKVYIKNPGAGYPLNNGQSCKIVGDGSAGEVSIEINPSNNSISDVIVTNGGKNYTYALIDLGTTGTPTTSAELIPIIPPSRGHGFDIYKELGADKVLVYARFDDVSKQFPVDSKFSQVGILKNPYGYDSSGIGTSLYTSNDFSNLYSIQLDSNGITDEQNISVDSVISQDVSNGKAYGYVVSYDSETKVLKYYQDRSLYYSGGGGSTHVDFAGISSYFSNSTNTILQFENSEQSNEPIRGVNFSGPVSSFSGIVTTINSKIINLGVVFTNGLANPEINSKSGEIIYIDNRPTVSRSLRQKEDVKIILEF